MDIDVKVDSNWTITAGDSLAKVVQTKVTHEDVFIKPALDEFLCEERVILLSQPSLIHTIDNPCEFKMSISPQYKIESLSMVCSASKTELFIGPYYEYSETIYGSIIEDDGEFDAEEQQGNCIRCCRYDIEIAKSGITHIMLKLLNGAEEICIFGIVLNIAPNPNGITTLQPNVVNIDNVEELLQNSNIKLSSNAEKCKLIMQTYKNPLPTCTFSAFSADCRKNEPLINAIMERMSLNSTTAAAEHTHSPILSNNGTPTAFLDIANDLKNYIDTRLAAVETKLLSKLAEYEQKQSTNIKQILDLLEKKCN